MIIVKDIEAYTSELQNILSLAVKRITEESVYQPDLLKLSGSLFERVVCETLNRVSADSIFENKFEHSSAHAFPDIYAKILENKWFGIEVKTSQGDWRCFGNSIFESVKIENLEDRIYVFFGKFSSNLLECRWAKYESCIDNINITHSPRYQINMDIVDKPDLSIFSKMDTSYVDFSTSDINKRMELVRSFKRKGLGQNVALWWLPDHQEPNEDDEKKLVIKLLSDLPKVNREIIRNQAMAFFPEIFSNNSKTKYSQVLTWLASQHGVVTGHLRDEFTSGGKWQMSFNDKAYALPKICLYLYEGRKQIKEYIQSALPDDLEQKWKLQENVLKNNPGRLQLWINIVSINLTQLNTMPQNFPIQTWLSLIFR
ncbi:hypothetical protein [Mucilaginibacter sp. R-33]|uniref:hypothetical protein n=1 Tax=Mucilaginibacter sp. R-33 TaxID=3416711 RepID=UPI003CFB4188